METKKTKATYKPASQYGRRELVARDQPLPFADQVLTYLETNCIQEGEVYFFDNGTSSSIFSLNDEAHADGNNGFKVDIRLEVTARASNLAALVRKIQTEFPQFKLKEDK